MAQQNEKVYMLVGNESVMDEHAAIIVRAQ